MYNTYIQKYIQSTTIIRLCSLYLAYIRHVPPFICIIAFYLAMTLIIP